MNSASRLEELEANVAKAKAERAKVWSFCHLGDITPRDKRNRVSVWNKLCDAEDRLAAYKKEQAHD